MTLAFLSPVNVAGTLTANDVLTVPQISAGGSTGTSGQFLKSTGTGLQWATISGAGTVTSVATGTGLTGGTITTSGTLAIDTTIVPQLAAANTFTASPQQITINAAGNKGLIVKGVASQTADLQQWQNSTSGVLAKVDASGNVTAASHVTTGGTSSQFVKGDGTLDSSTYLTTSYSGSTTITTLGTITSGYFPASNITAGSLAAGISPTAATLTSAAAGLGYTGMPQNLQTGSYTIAASDAGKHIYFTSSGTVTIPANTSISFPVGTSLALVAASGVTMTVSITSDTLLQAGTGATGNRTLASYGVATLLKIAPTIWMISGNGLT